MTTCDECLEIAKELKGYLAEARSLLDRTHDDRLRVVDALRRGETDAHIVEEFFVTAPQPRPGAYPGMIQAMTRKVMHERWTGHIVRLN